MNDCVRLAQCLCPLRHCILAVAFEPAWPGTDDEAVAKLETKAGEMIRDGILNQQCGICGSPRGQWRYEVANTRFRTMEEALPALAYEELLQRLTAMYLKHSQN